MTEQEMYLADAKIDGNIIPLRWFQTIGAKNRYGQFKANLLAINIMAELVYWYRPVAQRDELTGEFSGYKSKFQSDLYQFAYRHAKEKFGASKKSVKTACDLLVKLGAAHREFRHIYVGNVKHGNVMYMAPVLEWLKANISPISPKKAIGSIPKRHNPTTQKGETNTETSYGDFNGESGAGSLPLTPRMYEQKTTHKKSKVIADQEANHILNIMREHDKGFNRTQEIIKLINKSIKENGFEITEQAVRGRLMVKRGKDKGWRWLFMGNSDYLDALAAYEKENAAYADMRKRWNPEPTELTSEDSAALAAAIAKI